MGKSVKLKDLMNNPAYKRVSGDEESLEREVFVAEINRPGFELAGFFKHSDFRRIILLGDKENIFIREMTKESQLACFSKLVNDKHLVLLLRRDMKHQRF